MTEFYVFSVFSPSGHNTREQLARGSFYEGLQNYMENKNEGNENKIILGDFNCITDKMEREVEIKLFINAVSIIPCNYSPQKLKLGKINGTLIILFHVSLGSP